MVPRKSLPFLNGKINFPLCLAPMVGLSHVSLRKIVREYLPPDAKTLWPTEMLNSRRLPSEDLALVPESFRDDAESELVPQILGNDEKYIAPSVRKLVDWGAEAIDINMGCPVQKALRHNYGVSLMGDVQYASSVASMTVKNSTVPVSVKLRAGAQNDLDFLRKFVKSLEDVGVSWVTLHPRTAEQKRRGQADWSQINFLKNNVSIPVIGNGDIQTSSDVLEMLSSTGCDSVMAGRALAARPWMMWQLAEDLGWETGRSERAPRTQEEEGAEYGKVLNRLLENLLELHNEDLALRKFRFHVRTTSVWLLFGHDLYSKVMSQRTGATTKLAVQDFFDKPQAMSEKTELRQ